MTAPQILHILQRDIHSVVFATVDGQGLPCSTVIDLMLVDEKGLYFLTAHGKTFYSLRKDKIVGTETIKKLQHGGGIIDTRTISNLCEYLDCQPGDIMEYNR